MYLNRQKLSQPKIYFLFFSLHRANKSEQERTRRNASQAAVLFSSQRK